MSRTAPNEEVRRLLDALPDEASYEDIQYHIYITAWRCRRSRVVDRARDRTFLSDTRHS
ncbi:MAG TPA: hypothetical protein VM733_04290 [Thermoanaerobaculia bacterium]|nr:hypothetical protein [Thermoanaerobaculia bacterium]